MKENLEVRDNALYRITPRPDIGENVVQEHLVLTKEAFIQCYEKWIQQNGDKTDVPNRKRI